jgi:hypothetical protein
MQSCIEDLSPFPHAELSSLFVRSRDKNIYFSTCTHLAHYTTCIYAGFSTTTHVHQDLCQKMKINVGFPCHDRRSMILGLPYTGNIPTRSFSSILKAINRPILSYGKEIKNSTLRAKLLWRNYLLHIESTSLFPLSLNTVFIPQALPLLIENLIASLL